MSLSPSLRWRRWRRSATQLAVVGLALALIVLLGMTVRDGFAARGVNFSFDFLTSSAGFEISEGVVPTSQGLQKFSSGMTNAQALIAGLSNTLKVAVVAILLSTVIGVTLGVCRLSTNWLIRKLAFWITEFLRNTPLLIQLTFWYIAVVLQLPPVRQAPEFLGTIVSQHGIWLPAPVTTGGVGLVIFLLALVLGLTALVPVRAWRAGRGWLAGGAVALLVVAFAAGFRMTLSLPQVNRFRADGGFAVSPEYAALMIAITVNSAAYLGEIVRGAIEALPRGQWEAADAIGLSRRNVLRDVVLPQVFRVVMPSFGNQYISLAKNTSLGIAIGYPDLFNVYGTVSNQTGRSLEGVMLAMAIYLLLSWVISAFVNLINSRMKIPGVRS